MASGGSALAAVCSPSGVSAGDRARLLAAAMSRGLQVEAAAESEPRCWVVGRLEEAALAGELGLGAAPSPDRVVLAGWERWGDGLFSRLRGAFLILLWDPRRRASTLVVDQLGSASPYVRDEGGRLHLATDVQLLQCLSARAFAPDEVGVLHWLAGEAEPLGTTLFAGVERPLGGTYLAVDERGVRVTTYWKPRYREPLRIDADEATAVVWDALGKAVRRRLAGIESAGIIMSGGVDSTSVAAAATSLGFRSLRAYSAVFPGHRIDESERIDATVDALDLAAVHVEIQPVGAFALSLDYLDRWGVPGSGAGYLVEYPLLTEAAADGVTAVLDGQGGDELFGASGFLLADRVLHGRLLSSFQLTRRLPGARGRPARRLIGPWQHYVRGGAIPYGLHTALRRRRRARRAVGSGWLTPAGNALLLETDHALDWKRHPDAPRWWMHKAYLLTRAREEVRISDYLRERALMAGLEAIPPLLDVDLVETMLRVPPELEFDPDLDRPLIRRACEGRLPDSVRLSLQKSNLAPFYLDVAVGHDLSAMRTVLNEPDLRIRRWVDERTVRRMIESPPSTDGPPAWRWQSDVWRLSTVECWLRRLEEPEFVARLSERIAVARPAWSIRRRRAAGAASHALSSQREGDFSHTRADEAAV